VQAANVRIPAGICLSGDALLKEGDDLGQVQRPNNYKDTEPQMSSLVRFNRVFTGVIHCVFDQIPNLQKQAARATPHPWRTPEGHGGWCIIQGTMPQQPAYLTSLTSKLLVLLACPP
jgi:hypothetical protein